MAITLSDVINAVTRVSGDGRVDTNASDNRTTKPMHVNSILVPQCYVKQCVLQRGRRHVVRSGSGSKNRRKTPFKTIETSRILKIARGYSLGHTFLIGTAVKDFWLIMQFGWTSAIIGRGKTRREKKREKNTCWKNNMFPTQWCVGTINMKFVQPQEWYQCFRREGKLDILRNHIFLRDRY